MTTNFMLERDVDEDLIARDYLYGRAVTTTASLKSVTSTPPDGSGSLGSTKAYNFPPDATPTPGSKATATSNGLRKNKDRDARRHRDHLSTDRDHHPHNRGRQHEHRKQEHEHEHRKHYYQEYEIQESNMRNRYKRPHLESTTSGRIPKSHKSEDSSTSRFPETSNGHLYIYGSDRPESPSHPTSKGASTSPSSVDGNDSLGGDYSTQFWVRMAYITVPRNA